MPDQASTTRQCPFCKEEVKADATRCMHCQAAIPLQEKPTHQGICPFCKEDIQPDAIRCKHCKTDLVQGETQTLFREQRLAGLPAPFQRTASGRHMALRQTGKRSAENEPGVDPSGCLEVVHSGGAMYCLDYVYIEIDTNETTCFYTECVRT